MTYASAGLAVMCSLNFCFRVKILCVHTACFLGEVCYPALDFRQHYESEGNMDHGVFIAFAYYTGFYGNKLCLELMDSFQNGLEFCGTW